MPHIKNALIRYRIIDKAIRNKFKPYPSKKNLRDMCEEALFGGEDGDHICASTIEKDLFAMRQEHDAPIKYSKKHDGYFYTDENFNINDVPLSEDELDAISFAAKTLSQFRDSTYFQQFGSAIDKIANRVNTSAEDDKEQFIQFEKIDNRIGAEFLVDLLQAIKHSRLVEFDYASFIKNDMKRRCVLPLLLKEYKNRWYLICHDLDRNQIRIYALDRFEDLEILDKTMERPKTFKADNYFKHSIGVIAGELEPETIVFKANPVASRYLDSLKLHDSQVVIEHADDFVRFKMFAIISEELIREMFVYHADIQVEEPLSLRDELKERAKKLVNLYS